MVSCQLRSPRFTRNSLNGQWQPVVATGSWELVVAVADHFAYVAHTIFNKVFIHILPNNDSNNNSPVTTFIFCYCICIIFRLSVEMTLPVLFCLFVLCWF